MSFSRGYGRGRMAWVVVLAACALPAVAESLYRESTYRPLTGDNKAYRIGDALTVQVFENSSATTSTGTGTQRKNNLGAEASYGKNAANTSRLGLSIGSDFDGGGSTQRANRVLATLTVTVRDVLPNGDLQIAGEQTLTVNQEPQRVTVEGRVRPADVSDGNVILSTRIAEAKITYIGEGELTERSLRGGWRRFLDWVGF